MYLDPQHWFADSILDPNASILDPDSEFRHYLNPDQDPFINLEENVKNSISLPAHAVAVTKILLQSRTSEPRRPSLPN